MVPGRWKTRLRLHFALPCARRTAEPRRAAAIAAAGSRNGGGAVREPAALVNNEAWCSFYKF